MENHGNLILIDWLTVTFKSLSVDQIIRLLGLSGTSIVWQSLDCYMNGYPFRLSFDGINILYGARDDMGVCLTMSGQGCRAFESYGTNDWLGLFRFLVEGVEGEDINITRIDLAFDDHTGILDIDTLVDDTDDHFYVSKSRWWKVEYGSEGTSIYHGSPRSNTRIRIYDKAAERGMHDGTHWIRVELQLRDEIASSCVDQLTRSDVGDTFRAVLRNYLTYRVPSDDSNKSRWLIADYWEDLLQGVSAIRLWSSPGTEYNLFRMERWLVDQCGAAISCYRDILGLDTLNQQIKLKYTRRSPKYEKLVLEWQRFKDQLMEVHNE